MEMGNTADEEENERKLLADTSDDEDAAAEAEVRLIESTLAQNPYDYEAHKLLIEKLHQMGELDRLRLARENMSSKYPLTPEIWLAWLRDEMKLAMTLEQKIAVTELCERAVTDYLSVEIWLEYVQFSTGLGTEKETTEKIRNLFERALTAAGLHVMKGALIWDAFREFETFIVLMMDTNDAGKNDQINRIGKLYRRQLACPLIGMEKTYEEYEIWRSSEGCNCTEDDKVLKSGYERALTQLNERIPFEEKLELSESKSEQFDAYKAYIMKEKQIGDPGRVTVLYERAITDLCLESSLWMDYLQYVESHIKIDDITEKLFIRAVRNVPWCVKIWQNWIRFYEKKKAPLSDLQKLVENALAVGFSSPEEFKSLWVTYLEYLRRKIDGDSEDEKKQIEILRNAFNRACDHLATFGLEGDPNCEILQFWARFEAIHANDMEKARSLWADIMSQGHSDLAASWLEYISLERCYGDTKHLRKLFQKALASVKDWPESIANAWLNFERDEGTLEQMEMCELKSKERLDKVAEERKKSQRFVGTQEDTSITKKAPKRKMEDTGRWKNLGATSKVARVEKAPKVATKRNSDQAKHEVSTSSHKTEPKIAPPPGYDGANEEKMEDDSHSAPEVDHKITIFVSNLDYTASEGDIREALIPVGPITQFRMIKDYKGRSKGYCYVQLSSPEAVEEALKLDRTRINGRPMFISRCDPDKTSRTPQFKYKTELEKNKLFVKGLSPSTSKEDLEEIFKVHGTLKDVRIVTYRNGHSKGLAYVEFEDENSASKALVATDGMTIADKVVSVAISQPPQRKATGAVDDIRSLGGSSTSRTTFGNPKTVLSMIPRTVTRNVLNNKGEEVSKNGVPPPKTNADFRNMLLKK
ncbi:hypothetical protein QAD02_012367 [Eretmocerus hayati]|uniref:Uncharacterized protein n=1 Tax=Eretmocerus hayati TaxID=131215 RepID=A0ACC2NZG5_9HYME|nr:hypothetical protein QAD02_012367 [Eretmocerus hayati]